MKAIDLRKLSAENLQEQLDASQAELVMLRMKSALGQLKQVHIIKAKRKEISRMKTVMSEVNK